MPDAKKKYVPGGDRATNVGKVRVVRFTDKAILVAAADDEALGGGLEKTWVPISQICKDSEIGSHSDVDDEGDLVVPLWLGEQNGWIKPF